MVNNKKMDSCSIDQDKEYIITITNSGNLHIDFYEYSEKFYEAARDVIQYLVKEAAAEEDIAKLDIWFFSTIYLYRHSLELLLKASIFQTVTDNKNRINIVDKIQHNLKEAFETLIKEKKLMINNNENGKWLMDYLSDISLIDKKSDMFRFPFGNNLNILFNKQISISLVSIRDNMNKAYSIIKGIYDTGVISEEEIKTPNSKLINEKGNYFQKSVVGYKYYQYSFYPYFFSYKEVANFLKNIIMKEKETHLFLPMCYLYRNAVELGLKRLIIEDSHIDHSKRLKIIKKNHSILRLWNQIVDEIAEYVNIMQEDASIVFFSEKYIRELHNFDSSSDIFRYPCNKKMNSYFLEKLNFDFIYVANYFEELCGYLSGFNAILQTVKEYEANAADDY